MAADWYCQAEGTEHGPMTVDQLRDMARSGRLTREDFVRKGDVGEWVAASRARGLFDGVDGKPSAPAGGAALARAANGEAAVVDDRLRRISSVDECISREEQKKRLGVTLVNGLVWLFLGFFVISTVGVVLIFYAVSWVVNWLLSEYNVRKLQAVGTTATSEQFPEISQALDEVCAQFEVEQAPLVIVINMSAVNAFAIKFARKKVIVLLSETLEGILDKPAELRFILGHEMAHVLLDHGKRGMFEIYKPASYKAAREMTCDNLGCAAAGDLASSKTVLKRLGVGNKLYPRLDEDFLIAESSYIYSGVTGWFLKQYLTYPPLGKRIANLVEFVESA